MSCVCCSSFLRMHFDHCQGKILEQRGLWCTSSLSLSTNTLPWPQHRARAAVLQSTPSYSESLCTSLICYSLLDTRKSNDFPSQLVLLHYANNVL